MDKEIKVYQSINEKKGIISVNFYNPVTGRKTTKSLGREIGTDIEKAQVIIEQLKTLINNENYYSDYTGYLDAKRDFANDIIVKMVFSGAEFLKIKNEEERIKYIDNKISIIDESEKYKGKSIQLLGDAGAGKTKTIQQLLGSIEHNTPASSTSNTTVSDFEAVINGHADGLKMVVSFLDKEELSEYIKDNVLKCIKLILSSHDNEEGLNNAISTNIMISDDMKLRLNFLLRNMEKYKIQLSMVNNNLKKLAHDSWCKFTEQKKLIILKYTEASKELKIEFSEYLEEERDLISDEILRLLMAVIVNEMNEVIIRIASMIRNYIPNDVTISGLEIVTYIDKYETLEDLKIGESNWPKYFYLEMKSGINNQYPDKIIRDFFWKVFRNISCADENMANLYPLIASSRIEGNFKPLWLNENEIENAVFIDSEGFGHDVDKLVFTPKTIKNMQKVDMVLWIVDSTRGMTNNDKLILEELLRNGCINKMKMCFNRLEKMDKNSEATDEAKQNRIDALINNLFKNFEEKQYQSSVDVYSYKENVMQRNRRYYCDYLDEVIEDESGIWTTEAKNTIEKLNLEHGISLKLKTKVNYTIGSFEKIVEWINSKEEQSSKFILDYSPIYSSSVLSRMCDSEIIKYKAEVKKKIRDSHWNTVRAFTARMYYNSPNYRGWGGMFPENELKRLIKDIVLEYLTKPLNYNDCEEGSKALFREIMQTAQIDLAMRIDEFVEKKVGEEIKGEWKKALDLNGPGSGLERKINVVKILDELLKFEEQKQVKNMIYVELYWVIKRNEVLKELGAKIEI